MPELPEVETIRRDLQRALAGHAVTTLEVLDRRLLSAQEEERFRHILVGRVWRAINRKGKYLSIDLGEGWDIIFHLRMTGQLILSNQGERQRIGILNKPLGQTHRMLLEFDHGLGLAFYDQRRFGEVFLKGPRDSWPGKTTLGPDPLNGLKQRRFVEMVKEKTTRIKPLLMDQRFLAGVGNIYAQEALFKAAIRPSRPARRLTRKESERLYDALRETLLGAIEHRGSTSRNYRDALGQSGTAQQLHTVYQRGGQPCLRCQGTLKATRLGGRGTVYCPKCQD